MASLDDTLARVAPKSVEGLQVEWCFDHTGVSLDITGWFSPGLKLGEPRYQVPFKARVQRTGDAVADMQSGVDSALAQLRERLRPAVIEPVKRGRPVGSKNKPKTRARR
jgi:hypothetical protein